MMLGSGIALALSFPFGMMAGASNFPLLGFASNAVSLYAWAFALAGLSSVAGAWAWNAAVRRLPLTVTGQLIAVETVFATVFGLIAQWRMPQWDEAVSTISLVLGAVLAVRTILAPSNETEVVRECSAAIPPSLCPELVEGLPKEGPAGG
jgi:threonine/homoserine efflux transporter RhtA